MQKIIYISLIFPALLLSKLSDDIESQRQQLIQKKADLVQARQKLVDTYNQLNDQLITGINIILNGDPTSPDADKRKGLKEKSSDLQKQITPLREPGTKIEIGALGLSDLPDDMNTVNLVLINTIKVLTNISSRFQPVINELNPSTDPNKVYANFDKALAAMDTADKQIQDLENFIKSIGE